MAWLLDAAIPPAEASPAFVLDTQTAPVVDTKPAPDLDTETACVLDPKPATHSNMHAGSAPVLDATTAPDLDAETASIPDAGQAPPPPSPQSGTPSGPGTNRFAGSTADIKPRSAAVRAGLSARSAARNTHDLPPRPRPRRARGLPSGWCEVP
ncbi:MAG TPA: hypothetical protein VMA73_25960 [Streptosporangiaceae bacterium]|nr:hypothetical protein [Streptosporangiaceae bacterium]